MTLIDAWEQEVEPICDHCHNAEIKIWLQKQEYRMRQEYANKIMRILKYIKHLINTYPESGHEAIEHEINLFRKETWE